MLIYDFSIAIVSSYFRILFSHSQNSVTLGQCYVFCYSMSLGSAMLRKRTLALSLGNLYLCPGSAINSLGFLNKFLDPLGFIFLISKMMVMSYTSKMPPISKCLGTAMIHLYQVLHSNLRAYRLIPL